MSLKLGAVVVVYNLNYDVLCVTRPGDDTRWNLPGGKVEWEDIGSSIWGEGSTFGLPLGFAKAARRELKEETGLDYPLNKFRPILCTADFNKRDVCTFLFTIKDLRDNNIDGMVAEPGTKIAWMRLRDLVEVCPFAEMIQAGIKSRVFRPEALV